MKPKEWLWLLAAGVVLLLSALFTFDTRTEQFLAQLNTVFALRLRLAWGLIKLFLGLRPYPTSGLRTAAQQAAQHAANPKNPAPNPAKPDSHMQGRAMDCNYLDATGKNVLNSKSTRDQWSKVVEIYKVCGLRWGGNFSNYYDAVHVDDL